MGDFGEPNLEMEKQEAAPLNTLRHLVCSVCGLSNTDPSWMLIGDEWVHACPVKEQDDDDPTPVTVDQPKGWSPPPRKK